MREPKHLGLWVVLALFGFLVGVGFVQERLREETSPARRAELERLIEQRRAAIRQLSSEVEKLSERVEEVQARAGAGSSEVEDLVDRVERLRHLVGVGPVRGPGLVVELSDSERPPRTRDEITDLRIQDVDVRLVVNALWRSGAEAVAVNGRRVTSTTAIRKAGAAILVNYRAVSSPYRVVALGDPASLERGLSRSEIAERFEVWREIYELGFDVETEESLLVPGLRGPQDFRYAAPLEPAR